MTNYKNMDAALAHQIIEVETRHELTPPPAEKLAKARKILKREICQCREDEECARCELIH